MLDYGKNERIRSFTMGFLVAFILLHFFMAWKFYSYGFGLDYMYYYHAARGNYEWVEKQPWYDDYDEMTSDYALDELFYQPNLT